MPTAKYAAIYESLRKAVENQEYRRILPSENQLAERYGTYVVGSELVGLAPAKALLDCAEFYLKLEKFDCKNQIMEYHIIDMLGNSSES